LNILESSNVGEVIQIRLELIKQYDNIYSGLYISNISLDPIKNQVYTNFQTNPFELSLTQSTQYVERNEINLWDTNLISILTH